ncbi:hypothetical protein Hanom_Chr14g01270181 [Helianthus anomalus]
MRAAVGVWKKKGRRCYLELMLITETLMLVEAADVGRYRADVRVVDGGVLED